MSNKHAQDANWPGSILRAMREEKGLTRECLAEQANTGLRHLAAIELGEKNPSAQRLLWLIRGIGTSADRLFYPELYEDNPDLERISRLAATCTPKQRKLLISFIELLLSQKYSEE